MIVAVSADLRYGPIYNQGIAQQIYESLLRLGYPPDGGIPLTLIGYSGGGQISMGTLPFLKRALKTPIEVISLGGVMSGNVNALEVEQLYHLVGRRDPVERVGPVMFPRRWPIAMLSYWNRAKQQGRISFISLGPVGHQVPGGIFDPHATLRDGRTHLEQTLDLVMEILTGDLRQLLDEQKTQVLKPGRYYRYQAAPFNRPDYYPSIQTVDTALYRPVADWIGRLILPEKHERAKLNGVWLELLHTPAEYRQWIGHRVPLRWQQIPEVLHRVQFVTRDIHFSAEADYSYRQGTVLPIRLNHWRLVDPLESLAGAHPEDDLIVKLPHPVQIYSHTSPPSPVQVGFKPTSAISPSPFSLHITHDPIQITGRFYALVQFVGPEDDQLERYRVVHFNRETRQFDGPEDTVLLPAVVPDANNIYAAVNRGLEKTPQNQTGWYIYGAQNHAREFVVKALKPRCLHQVQPDRLMTSGRQGYRYIRKETWSDLAAKKGTAESVLIDPGVTNLEQAVNSWQMGDRALLVHIYGGIGGNKKEPAARGPIYFGHFAYGIATVVREPLADELQFDLQYHQVYTHNTQGLTAGTFDWTRYMGDRQWGFLGTRPTSDILIRLPAFTKPFNFYGEFASALDGLQNQLEIMTARYRTGDGTGVTYVGPANNCAQDSNQAMYASARRLEEVVAEHKAAFRNWENDHPDQAQTFEQLLALRKDIQQGLLPFGSARADWEEEREALGSNLQDYPLKTLGRGLVSWRTILPRKASDTITQICLRHGAALWVLRTNQLGGYDSDIEPIPPITL
jgi:predicted Abi (CAAX) family protease